MQQQRVYNFFSLEAQAFFTFGNFFSAEIGAAFCGFAAYELLPVGAAGLAGQEYSGGEYKKDVGVRLHVHRLLTKSYPEPGIRAAAKLPMMWGDLKEWRMIFFDLRGGQDGMGTKNGFARSGSRRRFTVFYSIKSRQADFFWPLCILNCIQFWQKNKLFALKFSLFSTCLKKLSSCDKKMLL